MSAILPSAVACCAAAFCDAPISLNIPGPAGPAGADGADGASIAFAGLLIVDNLAAARALPALDTNRLMVMLGGATASDTFGGIFWWDATSFALDDYTEAGGGVIVTPAGQSSSGRWIRMM